MKRILITGGSRGIGAACVARFAKEGDKVAFFYRERKEDAQKVAANTGATAIRADVSDPEAVPAAVEAAVKALGGIDVLVNNAGVSRIALLTDTTEEDWSAILGTNLSGAYRVTREVIPHLVRQQAGAIVNVGSMWGKVGASCEAAYSASKAGLRGLTAALAKELGPSGITVNCVEPGVIRTEMNAALDEETLDALCDGTPLCRLGSPEEVANAVYFLASDEASFITGQILGVDGGFAI